MANLPIKNNPTLNLQMEALTTSTPAHADRFNAVSYTHLDVYKRQTWVGEEGPELVNLPRGSRILPNKESVSLTSNAFGGVVQGSMAASSGNGGGMSSVIGVLTNIDQHLSALIDRIRESRSSMEVPGSTSSGGARGFLGRCV